MSTIEEAQAMSRRTELQLDPSLAQWAIQALARGAGSLAVIQGLAVIVGGRGRWQGPAYATALQVPGAPASWGIVLALVGLLVIAATFICRPRVAFWSLLAQGAWCAFFALAFAKSAFEHPNASTGGVITYGGIAIACTLLAVVYRHARRICR